MGKIKRELNLDIVDQPSFYYKRFPGQVPMGLDSSFARMAMENRDYYPNINFQRMGNGNAAQGARMFWDELQAQANALPEERRKQYIERYTPDPLPPWERFVYDPALDVDALGMATKAQKSLKNPAANSRLEVQGKTRRRTKEAVDIANAVTERDRTDYTAAADAYMADLMPYSAKVPAAETYGYGLGAGVYSNMLPAIYDYEGNPITDREGMTEALAGFKGTPRGQLGLDGSMPQYEEGTGPYTFATRDPVSRGAIGQLEYGIYRPGVNPFEKPNGPTVTQTAPDPSMLPEVQPFSKPLPNITEPEMIDEAYSYQIAKGEAQKADIKKTAGFTNYTLNAKGEAQRQDTWGSMYKNLSANLNAGVPIVRLLTFTPGEAFGNDPARVQQARNSQDFVTVYGSANTKLTGSQAYEVATLGKIMEQFVADWITPLESGKPQNANQWSKINVVTKKDNGEGKILVPAFIDNRTGRGFTLTKKPRVVFVPGQLGTNEVTREQTMTDLDTKIKESIQLVPGKTAANTGFGKYSSDKTYMVVGPGINGEEVSVNKGSTDFKGYQLDAYLHDWTIQSLGRFALDAKGQVKDDAAMPSDDSYLISKMPDGYGWSWLTNYFKDGSKRLELSPIHVQKIAEYVNKAK